MQICHQDDIDVISASDTAVS